MKVHPAPDLNDVEWNNLRMRLKELSIRLIVICTILVLLYLFWSIPVAFVSSISNLENLAKIPGLNFLVALTKYNATLKGFIQSFLPSLALIIFMAIFPLILRGTFLLFIVFFTLINLKAFYHFEDSFLNRI